jgi:1-acyl-sn-glycerol-3-phosphate acyltransferase
MIMSSRPRLPLHGRVARLLIGALLRLFFRVSLEGALPTSGPYILAANHQGWTDAFLLMAVFPAEPRITFFADRTAVTHVWWKRAVMAVFGGAIRVDRERRSDHSAVDEALAYLACGGVLVIFPEGRVSRAEDRLIPFRRGVGYLALKSGVPVVPVGLQGTGELYLSRELLVRVGAPRVILAGPATKERTIAVAETIRADVRALIPPWREPELARKRWRWLTDVL